MSPGFSHWPAFTQEEADAIQEVLLSNRVNYWTGDRGKTFECAFAAYCGTRYAIALANGTLALEVALRGLRIGPGDEIIVTCRSFIASASCIVNAGARPVFADVDQNSQNIFAGSVEALVNERTRAILCVHHAGFPCDMDPIVALADKHDLYVIEDCAQAHGAKYKGRSVGSIGHVAAWSFCQDKIISTGGEGGMVTTNDERLWSRMWAFKDHGKSYDAVFNENHASGYRWVHSSIGTNARMTEIQAALGLIQLGRLAEWHAKRRANALAVYEAANSIPGIRVPTVNPDVVHAWYKCYLFVEPCQLKSDWSRDRIVHEINDQGVPCFTGSCPEIYLEKAFEEAGLRPVKRLPTAARLGKTSLMFLVHPTLTADEIAKTCRVIESVMKLATF